MEIRSMVDREYWEDKTAIIPDWKEFIEAE